MVGNYVDSYTMSSFYNKISLSNQYVSPEIKTRKNVVTNNSITELISESDKFKDKIRRLDNYKRSTHQNSKLIKNINSFVKEYNSFKKKADGSNDPQINKKMEELEKLITDNKKELKKAGISVDKKNQLGFDSSDYDEINKKVFEGLFSGNNSFIKKASKIIRDMNNYSRKNEVSEEKVKYHPAVNYSQYDMAVAKSCNILNHIVSDIFNKEEINFDWMSVMDFADVYNDVLSKSSRDPVAADNLKKISSEKQEELAKIGITIESNGRYKYDSVDDKESADTAFDLLFHDSEEGEPTEYVSAIKQSIYDIFRHAMQTEKIGVTIDQKA